MYNILGQAEEYITQLLRAGLKEYYYYHSIEHTFEVYDVAKTIANRLSLSEKDRELLLIAVLFHDSGMTRVYEKHEVFSVQLANEYLKNKDVADRDIQIVKEIILATRMPHNPQNNLQEIIADSDISHMGNDNFDYKSYLLRKEWETVYERKYSEEEWLKINIEFLENNHFYTEYGKENFASVRLRNLEKYKNRLSSLL